MNLEDLKNLVFRRKGDYARTFRSETGKAVLADLARFCRANESTFHEQHAIHCKLDGRREVWLRIQQHLELTDAQMWALVSEGS